ncbi:DEAD/DEAH box helicase [Olsenella uli]|uniref:DEAD/DEAH box helicase n=1 Tax=Olsenella uli TaxID=133926 RepID=UPI0012AB977D
MDANTVTAAKRTHTVQEHPTGATSEDAPATSPAAPGSLGELVPDLWFDPKQWPDYEPEAPLTPDEALDRYLDWCAGRGMELWPHQEEALLDLAAGDHVILGTPTGSGKSMVALGLAYMTICQHRRAYYTAPIKALVSEKFFDLVEVLGRDNVGMITGDTHINTDAPVICCTEEILANQALREGAASDMAAVAMDEFHFFGEADRGWAWQVPLLTLPNTQFLLMSATLGDTSAISAALGRQTGRTVNEVTQAERPVPLSYQYVDTSLEATVELALRDGDAPIYIVHFAQDAALNTAQSLASYGVATKEQRDAVKEACKGTRFTTAFGKTLQRLLGCGVGVHHAGMLPRYRLLVEKLAQQGLLPVICGTDTLGVGINVPIHTVLLTALTKYDGHRMRRLRSREFHQIAGRAGRAGFDTEGRVIAEAPEYEIENAKALLKAGGDIKKQRKVKKKRPPEGFVNWGKETFERLIAAPPETLVPRLRITNSMVLAECEQGADAHGRIMRLIADSLQTDTEKAQLVSRADEIFATLIDAGVIERTELADAVDAASPQLLEALPAAAASPLASPAVYSLTVDLPEDFALDQPLSPFLLAALELLDPESDTYDLDLISMVEATLEDPYQVLRAQEREARGRALAEMKAEGLEYDERMDKLAEITYPKPLEDELNAAFETYCEKVPWARDYCLRPKSILRDILETAADFKTYIQHYKLARSEGTLLRYLSDAWRVLDRTVPTEKRSESLDDIVAWLGFIVRTTDSSLVDAWEAAGEVPDALPPEVADAVVKDRHGLTVLVRNALWRRVRLFKAEELPTLGGLDQLWGFGERRWRAVLDEFHDAHDELLLDADARSTAYFQVDESDEKSDHVWHVTQILHDADGDNDFQIKADLNLDATQEQGEVVFKNYRAGSIEELMEQDGQKL